MLFKKKCPRKFHRECLVFSYLRWIRIHVHLLFASQSAGRIFLVNLTKTLCVDLWYLKLYMGGELFENSVDLVVNQTGFANALAKPMPQASGKFQTIALQARDHQLLQKCRIDVSINIASMQEMEHNVTRAYFTVMREIALTQDLLFYCLTESRRHFQI